MQDRFRLTSHRRALPIRPGAGARSRGVDVLGRGGVAIEVHERVDEIVVNALDLEIDAGRLLATTDGEIAVTDVALDEELQRATLSLARPAEPGSWILHLVPRRAQRPAARLLPIDLHRRRRHRTRSRPRSSRPPTPAARSRAGTSRTSRRCFAITLVVPDGVVALSNGPEIERAPTGDGRGAGAVRRHDADVDVPGRVRRRAARAHRPGRRRRGTAAARAPARQGAPRALRARGRRVLACGASPTTTASPIPTRKVDLVAMPDFAQGAMENLGCITYRESLLLVDPGHATQPELRERRRRRRARARAHVVRRPRHDAVVERHLAERGVRDVHGDAHASTRCGPTGSSGTTFAPSRDSAHGRRRAALAPGRSSTRCTRPDDADGMFDMLTYLKGGRSCGCSSSTSGADRFRDGIRRYLRSPRVREHRDARPVGRARGARRRAGPPHHGHVDLAGRVPAALGRTRRARRLRFAQRRFLADGSDDTRVGRAAARALARRRRVAVLVPADGATLAEARRRRRGRERRRAAASCASGTRGGCSSG